jgi:hypothetical protein
MRSKCDRNILSSVLTVLLISLGPPGHRGPSDKPLLHTLTLGCIIPRHAIPD